MKSERRHELQTNALADWIGEAIERIRPYQTTLLGVVLLLLLLIVGGTWWSRHSASQSAEAWGRLNAALESGNPAAMLDDVVDHNRGTQIASMAGILAGDIYLGQGTQQRFVNRATANQDLAKAIERYKLVLDSSSSPLLKERATYGLARALETQGNLPDALAKYEEVEKTWPNGAYAAAVTRRLEDLRSPAIKKFYDDFRNYDPKPVSANEPGLPTRSDLSKPDSLKEPDDAPISLHDPRFNLGDDTSDTKDKKPDSAKPSAEKPAPVAPASKVK